MTIGGKLKSLFTGKNSDSATEVEDRADWDITPSTDERSGRIYDSLNERVATNEVVEKKDTITTTTTTDVKCENKDEMALVPVVTTGTAPPSSTIDLPVLTPVETVVDRHCESVCENVCEKAKVVEVGKVVRVETKIVEGAEVKEAPVIVNVVKQPPTEDHEIHKANVEVKRTVEVVEQHIHHTEYVKPPPVKDVIVQEHHHHHTEVMPAPQHEIVTEEHHHLHQKILPPEHITEKKDIHIDHFHVVQPETIVIEKQEEIVHKESTAPTVVTDPVEIAKGEVLCKESRQEIVVEKTETVTQKTEVINA